MTNIQLVQHKIYEIRGFQVMLDFDLAELYEIETKVLKQSVKRNIERFPNDFMFELTEIEWLNLRSQIVTSSWGGIRYLPSAFTEQGVAMLAGILRSPKAIEVNITVMRAFVAMRQFILQNKDIFLSIEELRQRMKALEQSGEETLSAINDLSEDTRQELDDIYIALAEMAKKNQIQADKPRRPIGFITND